MKLGNANVYVLNHFEKVVGETSGSLQRLAKLGVELINGEGVIGKLGIGDGRVLDFVRCNGVGTKLGVDDGTVDYLGRIYSIIGKLILGDSLGLNFIRCNGFVGDVLCENISLAKDTAINGLVT